MVDQRPVWLLTASFNEGTRQVSVDRSPIFTDPPILPGREKQQFRFHVKSGRRLATKLIVLRGETKQTAEVEAVWSVPLEAGNHMLTFELEASGTVRIQPERGPAPTRVDHNGFVLREYEGQNGLKLPREPEGGLDLLIVLDRIGQADAFGSRRDLASRVVAALAEQFELESSFRASVVAVADDYHTAKPPARINAVERVCSFVTASSALAALSRLIPASNDDFDYPSAIEQILGRLEAIPWGRPDAARVCLTITCRPPHPEHAGQHFLVPVREPFKGWVAAFVAAAKDKGILPMLVVFPSDWKLDPQFANIAAAQDEHTRESWQIMAGRKTAYGDPDGWCPRPEPWFVDEFIDSDALAPEIASALLEQWEFAERPLCLPEFAAPGACPDTTWRRRG